MWTFLDQVSQDIRFGIRSLTKSPGLTVIAVVSLALGIGATTAIYSVVHGVVLNPFPYKDVDNLMSVKVWDPGARGYRTGYTTDQFLEIEERNSIFEGTIASTISDVLWTSDGEPQRLRGNYVTTRTFSVMGVPPVLGRAITPADGLPDAPAVAVLGYKFWQRQFGGDAGVLGRQMRLNEKVRTIVGVMPPRFMWRGADVYLPIVFRRGQNVEGVRYVHLLGRLKPGVTEAQAQADLRPIIEELKKREPAEFPDKWRVGLLSFKETFPSGIREALWILLGAVALLLLIACANVSSLLLSKASSRQKEMAVRASLGANRARLVRQLLTESLLLAVAGGALGMGLAVGGLKGIIVLVPPGTIPDESEIALNTPVLIFALGLSMLTALVFGLAPALHASTQNLANPLREVGRGASAGLRQAALRKGLVVCEVALSMMLLVGASLMIRTLFAMQSVELGFRADRLLAMRIPLSAQRYPNPERRSAFFLELVRRVTSVPGVISAGLNTGMHPFGNMGLPVEVGGNAQQDTRPVVVHQINHDYTKALGIALVQGRLLTETEVASRQHLALVNQAFLRRYLPEQQPLGRAIRIPRLKTAPFNVADDSFQIAGVVKDTLNRSVTNEVSPEIYFPFTITGLADRLVVLTQSEPAALTNAVRSQVYALDSAQPVTNVSTIDAILDEAVYARPRFNLLLFSVFAGLGLILAVIGVYGVVSSSVSRRTQEMGIRIALGAGAGDIVTLVVSGGFKLLLAGIALGLAGSFAAARLLSQQVWNVSTFDPLSFAVVSVIIFGIGLLACFLPARKAARVDPVIALRYE